MSVLVVGHLPQLRAGRAARAASRSTPRASSSSCTTPSASEHVAEATVLATCNRVEIYAEVDRFHGSVEDALAAAASSGPARAPTTMLPHLYVHYDDGAVSHLFQVAAGLDSMVVGEGQILGQTREALRLGQELGTVGPALNVLFQQALRVGKRVHAETDIDRAAPIAGHRRRSSTRRRDGGDLAGRRVVVVGAGVDGRRSPSATRAPAAAPARSSWSTAPRPGAPGSPRSTRRPRRRSTTLRRRARRGRRGDRLHRRRRRPVTAEHGRAAPRGPTTRPLVVIDLALPHDVDPAVAELPGVTLIDLAELADELHGHRGRPRGRRGAPRSSPRRSPRSSPPARRQRHPDRGRAARRWPPRSSTPSWPGSRPRLPDLDDGRPRRGPADRAPGRRQAAARADRPGQGARQRRPARCPTPPRWPSCSRSTREARRRRHPRPTSERGSSMTAPATAARRHPRRRCSPRTQAELVADAGPRAGSAARSSWSRSPPTATAARPPARRWPTSVGTGVFVSALRDALLARRDRRRRALAEGPADRRRRRASRWPPYRRARTPATSSSPATG